MTEQAHTQRAHAKLAPSSAYRWLVCPGSIRMSEGLPDTKSVYAAEGTAAHELAQFCFDNGRDPLDYVDEVIDIETGKIAEDEEADFDRFFTVDEEMANGVAEHIEYVRSIAARDPNSEVEIESRLDLTHIAPDMFGTGDTLVYLPETAHLFVIDFKYGKNVVVEPEENEQLLTYAVGALKRYHNRDVQKVTLVVTQPRKRHAKGAIREWETDYLTVKGFEARLASGARATEKEDAELVAGEHCFFCKAAATCPAYRKHCHDVAMSEFTDEGEIIVPAPEHMTPERLRLAMKEAETLKAWIRRVEQFVHAQALEGIIPAGFKLVQKRANRRWIDPVKIAQTLRMVFDLEDDKIYKPRAIQSPAKIEKLLGKKREHLIKPLYTKPQGGFVLAPEDDLRPPVQPDATKEFAE